MRELYIYGKRDPRRNPLPPLECVQTTIKAEILPQSDSFVSQSL